MQANGWLHYSHSVRTNKVLGGKTYNIISREGKYTV